ncbi:hypothetical protein FACS189432_00060 [Bacteroidia bacterium]|nr:hypothetical protein FACS189426_01600 [Bacteroidia bacterium]GHT26180.1 hypothetical protein FACS189432_00060 [Bacteroidia bacterium]GHT86188.1 hypothetical protein FACS18947_5840 [Bacteroidia bacterium]
MNTLKNLSIAAGLLFLQTAAAQSPAIDSRYSDSTIVRMVEKFRASHSRDVFPAAHLQQKFQNDFPKARDVEWETANDIYEVEFEVGNRDFKALYDTNGNLLMVNEEIHRSALPAVVKNAAESKYPKYSFEDIHKIRRGTETVYKIEMEKQFSDTEVRLLVKSDGTVVEENFDY